MKEREEKKHKELNKEMTENKTKQLKATVAHSFSPTRVFFYFSNLMLKFIPRHIETSRNFFEIFYFFKEVIDAA